MAGRPVTDRLDKLTESILQHLLAHFAFADVR